MSAGTTSYGIKIRISTETGKAQKEVEGINKGISKLVNGAATLGRGFERMGRTISITGFVMGIVARRLIASFEGIAKSIVKISEEGANLDRAFTFLSDTLSALALSGMLTDETFNDIYGTFQRMMDIAMASAGSWAIINAKIQELKNAIAEGALPQLTNLSTFFTEFDMTPFNTALKNATDTFLTPIVDKIKEMLGEGEEGGLTGISAKLNAIAMIGGNFLAGVLEGFDQVMIKAAELVGDDASGIAGISSKLGEYAAWALVLAPAGAITGMIVGGFGSIIAVVSNLAKLMGGLGAGTLLAVGALIILDWEHWSTDVIPDLLDAVGDLMNALGGGDTEGLAKFLKGMSVGVEIIVRGIETWIRVIAALIQKLRELATWQAGTSTYEGGVGGSTAYEGSRQGGGLITRTGSYLLHAGERVQTRHESSNYNYGGVTINVSGAGDPEAVADAVDRKLAQRRRTVFMPR